MNHTSNLDFSKTALRVNIMGKSIISVFIGKGER